MNEKVSFDARFDDESETITPYRKFKVLEFLPYKYYYFNESHLDQEMLIATLRELEILSLDK